MNLLTKPAMEQKMIITEITSQITIRKAVVFHTVREILNFLLSKGWSSSSFCKSKNIIFQSLYIKEMFFNYHKNKDTA